jgi:hypothetical protein
MLSVYPLCPTPGAKAVLKPPQSPAWRDCRDSEWPARLHEASGVRRVHRRFGKEANCRRVKRLSERQKRKSQAPFEALQAILGPVFLAVTDQGCCYGPGHGTGKLVERSGQGPRCIPPDASMSHIDHGTWLLQEEPIAYGQKTGLKIGAKALN